MRIITLILAAFFIVTACNQSPADKATGKEDGTEIEVAAENLITIDFEVRGMTCTGCENAVTSSIAKLEGIKSATASHTDSCTVVSFDKQKTDSQKIKEAIEEAGYEVTAFTEVSNNR